MATEKETIRLRVGEEHPVRLESLLTAGYEWMPEADDPSIANVLRSASTAEGEQAIGAAPDEVFTIKAVRPGKATVRFAQRRPWERGARSENEHVVELDVTD
ncbi:MAG TPA: protease inhibitor I42 family protein [Gaiellaceae bacterium]|nr:protease inhibitor I42 family protein [Gaiellaceae bacterium]